MTKRAITVTFNEQVDGLDPLGTHAEGFLRPSQWEPRLAHVPDFGPGPDEVTEDIRAQGAPHDYPAAQPTPPV